MTNGWLIAAAADGALGAELAAGFELELMRPGPPEEREAALAQLAEAANVGVLVSNLAANDDAFVALVRLLAGRRADAQIILAEPEARALFPFLPDTWPVLPLEEALRRARLAASRRAAPLPPTASAEPEPPEAAPPPYIEAEPPPLAEPAPEPAPLESRPDEDVMAAPQDEPAPQDIEPSAGEAAPEDDASAVDTLTREETFGQTAPAEREQASVEHFDLRSEQIDEAKRVTEAEEQAPAAAAEAEERAPAAAAEPPEAPPSVEPPSYAPPPDVEEPAAPPQSEDEALAPARKRAAPSGVTENPSPSAMTGSVIGGVAGGLARQTQAPSAPADATAFAPKKLRRGEAELVRIAIHQPKDLQAVIKAARQADPRTTPAPQSMGIGEVQLGASVGVSLEVKGAACDGALQRRTWIGSPLEFSFAVEADPDVRQVVILARVFVGDAQIGVLAFTRGVTGPKPKPLSDGERARLKRHKHVFLSYSSRDRETVSAIATAYEAAGIPHFWDRSSLKSGEEWHPRLRREIDRCDLFHLCWSKSAATSEWVEKEATHALGLRRRRKRPDITVQMLDGPPWAKHPDSLDSINFDDFVRAAIVGYARGDGAG